MAARNFLDLVPRRIMDQATVGHHDLTTNACPLYTLGGMKKVPRILALTTCAIGLALPAAVAGCSADPAAGASGPGLAAERPAGHQRVGVAEFAGIIASPGVQIIDVRTPEEFVQEHIAGAVNIPIQSNTFKERVGQLDPAVTYAVYCRSGNRSQAAVSVMKDAGIASIYELANGTTGWAAAGQPLVR